MSSGTTAVVLIGTNNVGVGYALDEVVAGIVAVVDWLLRNTKMTVVLSSLMPRGAVRTDPFRVAVRMVNMELVPVRPCT